MRFKWLDENADELHFIGTIWIIAMIVWSIGVSIGNTIPKAENMKFMQLAGLNIPELNGSIIVPLNVTNNENYTIQLFSICYCDPEELQAYVMFSTDLANYTRIDPGQTLLANVTVHEEPNNLNGEVYIRFYGLIP